VFFALQVSRAISVPLIWTTSAATDSSARMRRPR
jgi:hypothetical protein